MKTSKPPPLPRSRTTSPRRRDASAFGFPQESPRFAPSGSAAKAIVFKVDPSGNQTTLTELTYPRTTGSNLTVVPILPEDSPLAGEAISGIVAAAQAGDYKDCKDHPLFPDRMPGDYWIHHCKSSQFDAFAFYTSGDLTRPSAQKTPPMSPAGKKRLLEAIAAG